MCVSQNLLQNIPNFHPKKSSFRALCVSAFVETLKPESDYPMISTHYEKCVSGSKALTQTDADRRKSAAASVPPLWGTVDARTQKH